MHEAMSSKEHVSLQQIAERAGVARSTVSKALHNNHQIPEHTRIRIQQIAEEMGYRRNPTISSLMAQLRHIRKRKVTETIAWITAFPEREGWKRPRTFSEYYKGATERAQELGFSIKPFWLGDTAWKGTRLSTILRTRAIRGVLVAPVPEVTTRIDLNWDDFASAVFGYSLRQPRCHRVTTHQFQSMLLLLRHLDEGGFRRIGLVFNSRTDQRTGSNITAGMLTYQQYIPPENRIPLLRNMDLQSQELGEWMQNYKPDALIALNHLILGQLTSNNIKVPYDISVAFLQVEKEEVNKAGIYQNSEYIGPVAVELLAEQLYENRIGLPTCQKTILVEGEYRGGESVRFPLHNKPSLDWNLLL